MMKAISQIQTDLISAIDSAMAEIDDFVSTKQFQAVFSEMSRLPLELRHEFVELVWVNPDALQARGLVTPPGITIQRSAFGDKRPTLFCVCKLLPDGLLWHKVTITIDNPAGPPAVNVGPAPEIEALACA
jgi:hypothetical protein